MARLPAHSAERSEGSASGRPRAVHREPRSTRAPSMPIPTRDVYGGFPYFSQNNGGISVNVFNGLGHS
jgi:hypothetical protein